MVAGLAAVVEDVLGRATSFFEGVGQDGNAVEGTVVIVVIQSPGTGAEGESHSVEFGRRR